LQPARQNLRPLAQLVICIKVRQDLRPKLCQGQAVSTDTG
jgi:hypothetical protein